MSGEILIQYDEVYSKTAELRNRITSELRDMDTAYRQAQSSLRGMDGKTNAVLIEAMAENQRKARITADTLNKLLSFIETSARQVERDEQIIKRTFARTRVSATRESVTSEGGDS